MAAVSVGVPTDMGNEIVAVGNWFSVQLT